MNYFSYRPKKLPQKLADNVSVTARMMSMLSDSVSVVNEMIVAVEEVADIVLEEIATDARFDGSRGRRHDA